MVKYYLDKTITVVGKVFLEKKSPYIKVEDPDRIEVVKEQEE